LVIVNGQQERHAEGAYYLEWRENGKRVRLSVGKDAADASARRLCKEAELNAVNHGVGVVPENGNGHRSLSTTVAEYLEETKLSKKPKTTAAYSTALAYFVESCHKINLADVDRKDLLKFAAFLRDEKGQVQRLEDLSEAGGKPKGKKCKGMDGLIEEGSEVIEEDFEGSVKDAALIGAAQRVEHYEIAGYGTVRSMAETLGEDDHVSLLEETLEEEKETDEKLTQLAEQINKEASQLTDEKAAQGTEKQRGRTRKVA
jgi:ferritin-like metal-binding protein YciE